MKKKTHNRSRARASQLQTAALHRNTIRLPSDCPIRNPADPTAAGAMARCRGTSAGPPPARRSRSSLSIPMASRGRTPIKALRRTATESSSRSSPPSRERALDRRTLPRKSSGSSRSPSSRISSCKRRENETRRFSKLRG